MLFLEMALWILSQIALLQEPRAAEPAAVPAAVTFAADVQPILERRCTPCHFPGGVMHERLPFDNAETVHELGTKLFTRIKARDEQKVIRAFLAN